MNLQLHVHFRVRNEDLTFKGVHVLSSQVYCVPFACLWPIDQEMTDRTTTMLLSELETGIIAVEEEQFNIDLSSAAHLICDIYKHIYMHTQAACLKNKRFGRISLSVLITLTWNGFWLFCVSVSEVSLIQDVGLSKCGRH